MPVDIAVDADADADADAAGVVVVVAVAACALPADSNGQKDVAAHDDADGDLLALGDGERNFGGLDGHLE